ncbi:FAD-dependent oxidoreductase [Streptomyces sp. NPDC057445]|uniref:FAD-dependent oxidoreductase n=1 Tax=Streptomyces sp. NPDC057445 TaxID=3346136 RepID=UPI0036B73688
MTLPGQPGGSLWTEYDPDLRYPSLRSDIRVDVAVIGGGMAGLCTARELARSGRTVAVLEADRIASPATARPS